MTIFPWVQHHPLPAFPLKGEENNSHLLHEPALKALPFKGRVGWGWDWDHARPCRFNETPE